jgi:hypothetical protein
VSSNLWVITAVLLSFTLGFIVASCLGVKFVFSEQHGDVGPSRPRTAPDPAAAAAFPLLAVPGPLEEWAFVLYSIPGSVIWHQRLRVRTLAGSLGTRDLIATPDGQVYEESLHGASADIAAVRFAVQRWPPPVGVPRAQTYRFRTEPSVAQRAHYIGLAQIEADTTWRNEFGPPLPPGGTLELIRAIAQVGVVALAPGPAAALPVAAAPAAGLGGGPPQAAGGVDVAAVAPDGPGLLCRGTWWLKVPTA